jgi:anthranilate synthase component 2
LKILLIDNYDSFTYNIVEQLRQCQVENIVIVKNDEFEIEDALHFEKIIISPGPKTPKESGKIIPLLQAITTQSVLGICLGHQAIAEAFGADIYNLEKPYHGAQTQLKIIAPHFIFDNIKQPITVGLYHSWAVKWFENSNSLMITSISEQNIIMSLKHKILDIHGVQFHPESFMSEKGTEILKNWLLKEPLSLQGAKLLKGL